MIKPTIEFINGKLASLNYFERSFGLCDIISKGEKTFPAEYRKAGEYLQINNFDKYNGVSYIRKRGDISIAPEDDTLLSCSNLYRMEMPLRLVAVIPRRKLDCDDSFSEDVIAMTIMRAVVITNGDLKVALDVRQASIRADGYSTDSISILSEEYSSFGKKDINYKFAYLALDLTASILTTQECLTRDCYGAYS